MNKKITIQEAFKILGINAVWVDRLQQVSSYESTCKKVEEFKTVLKKRKRQLMLQYHPDRNNGDVESTNKTKEILNLCTIFENIKVMRPQPVQQPVVVHYYYHQSYSSYGGTTTSTSGW